MLVEYGGDQLIQSVTFMVVKDDDLGKGSKIAENVVLQKNLRIFFIVPQLTGDR